MSDEQGGIKSDFIRALRERDEDPEVRRMFLERKDMAGYKAYTANKNDP